VTIPLARRAFAGSGGAWGSSVESGTDIPHKRRGESWCGGEVDERCSDVPFE